LQEETNLEMAKLKKIVVSVSKLGKLSDIFKKRENVSLADLLTVPGVEYDDIEPFIDNIESFKSDMSTIKERVSIFIKYKGYIRKQEREVSKFRNMESQFIPDDMPYSELNGLRNEAQEKFTRFKPISIGQAGRIEGITTGDIAALSVHLKKYKNNQRKRLEVE
ncbi:MAG: hypothetical protein GY865_00425, partial [candidate division Zixibacteria bacterium]|nr:hypothetical protein [candidate division Zixibacteria bacterium]